MPGDGIEGIDAAVAEIADQQILAELAEVGRRHGDAPGRIEHPAAGDAPDQRAVGVEQIDQAEASPDHLVLILRPLLPRVSNVKLVADGLDAEGRIAGGKRGIGETAGGRCRLEALVEDVDPGVVEVGGIEKIGAAVFGQRQAGVDRAGRAVVDHGFRAHVEIAEGQLRPGGKGAAFARVDELGRADGAGLADDEFTQAGVVDDAGGPGRAAAAGGDADGDRKLDAEIDIQGGKIGAVVGQPGRPQRIEGDAPGILQVLVHAVGGDGAVGHQVGDRIGAAFRRRI